MNFEKKEELLNIVLKKRKNSLYTQRLRVTKSVKNLDCVIFDH